MQGRLQWRLVLREAALAHVGVQCCMDAGIPQEWGLKTSKDAGALVKGSGEHRPQHTLPYVLVRTGSWSCCQSSSPDHTDAGDASGHLPGAWAGLVQQLLSWGCSVQSTSAPLVSLVADSCT